MCYALDTISLCAIFFRVAMVLGAGDFLCSPRVPASFGKKKRVQLLYALTLVHVARFRYVDFFSFRFLGIISQNNDGS